MSDVQTTPSPLTPEEFVSELRALRARLPLPVPAAGPAALRRRLGHVDEQFIQVSVNTIGASEAVRSALGRSEEELRQEIDTIARWSAGNDELRALLQDSVAANTVRRQRVGLAALQTYQICQQLARDESHAALRPRISEMRRLNKFGRSRRKAASQPEPEPIPKTQ